jgi:hypothetical protein
MDESQRSAFPKQVLRMTGAEGPGRAQFECDDFLSIQTSLYRLVPAYDFLISYVAFDACLRMEQRRGFAVPLDHQKNVSVLA